MTIPVTTGDRLAPPQLAVVQEFLNSPDLASRRDELGTAEQMRRWLVGHRLVAPHAEFGDAEPRHLADGMGIDRSVGDLLVRVMAAMAAGTWPRLKVCANDDCGRAFYDTSGNRSARWCSMAICGNRIKGRAYRRRPVGAARELELGRSIEARVALAAAN